MIGFEDLEFVGHTVSKGQVGLHPDNVQKINVARRPQTKKEVRSFMGLVGYYRNYIPNFAAISAPLTDLTKKGKANNVEWGDAQENAFITLKQMLMNEPILQLPDLTKRFILQTDASNKGIGAVLLQDNEGVLMPVAYASKKLLPRQQAYSTIEKECLALVWAVKKFHVYLYGREFTLQTDHQPLVYMNQSRMTNDRVMRWALSLQPYRIHIEAIKGSQNVGADFLSRSVN